MKVTDYHMGQYRKRTVAWSTVPFIWYEQFWIHFISGLTGRVL